MRRASLLAAAAVAAVLAGCGGADDAWEQAPAGRPGGTLTVLAAGGVDTLDPGRTTSRFTAMVTGGTVFRTLMAAVPGDAQAVPDLAAEVPSVSEDGTSVTVRLRRGVRFAPPVDREVRAADVKYAIERAFTPAVGSPDAQRHFGALEGAAAFRAGRADGIAGLQAVDDHTLRMLLTEPLGGAVAAALVLPLTAPVPEEVAAARDRRRPSTYERVAVGTGPYMVERGAERLTLVRNPNWNASAGIRPAHLDRIVVDEGNDDTAEVTRRVLEGRAAVNGDVSPPVDQLRAVAGRRPGQVQLVPAGITRYLALNTQRPPFDDADVRRGVVAAFDRVALRSSHGGAILGDVATHLIPPGVPGFRLAGGFEGQGVPILAQPRGDRALAGRYFRRAGFRSGRYEGDARVLLVGVEGGADEALARNAAAQLERLGFAVDVRLERPDTGEARACGGREAVVAACPGVSVRKAFGDAGTVLRSFTRAALDEGDNHARLAVPAVERATERARTIVDPAQRAEGWAAVDELVVELAPGVPWLWHRTPNLRSADVRGAINPTTARWDLAFTSLR